MRLIIVHGFMNNIYHNSSYMINIDHCMKACWSCSATVDHCHERLLILHDHWYTTLLIMYHNCWSCHERPLIIHEKLIIAMKACWSCIKTVDHLSYCDHYIKTQCKDEFRNLSGCVTEILTASRINIFFFGKYHEKAEIHSFPTMYIMGGSIFLKWVK